MFKVDDRVKVVKILPEDSEGMSSLVGLSGPVVEIDGDTFLYPIWVDLPGGQTCFAEEELVSDDS